VAGLLRRRPRRASPGRGRVCLAPTCSFTTVAVVTVCRSNPNLTGKSAAQKSCAVSSKSPARCRGETNVARWTSVSRKKLTAARTNVNSSPTPLSPAPACRRTYSCRKLRSHLHEVGADFVRYSWDDYPATVALPSLAKASAACLPFREGFDRVAAALAEEEGSTKRDLMFSLGYFHSAEALDWIEKHIYEPITESWGYLAAASKLDWPRVENWFEQGRPLSLVAIDALAAIIRPQSPFLRAYGPRLYEPPSPDRFRQVLSAYAERDRVPRVQQRTSALITHADTLTKAG
jgi:hypothetical protein